jgi:hypothetical protein
MSNYERDDYDQPRAPSSGSPRDRVNLPGIFLIVVGIFNILGAIYPIANGLVVLLASEKFLTEVMANNPLVPKGQPVDLNVARAGGVFWLVVGVLMVVLSFVTILGGVYMRSLKGYGLAIAGAIIACVPCISAMACCGVGEGIGIWALVVLANPEVRAAFGAPSE